MNDEIYPDKILFFDGDRILFTYWKKIFDGIIGPTPVENIVEVLTKEIRFIRPE